MKRKLCDNRWQSSVKQWHKIKAVAREMRRKPTAAEEKLWNELKSRKLCGVKFRRQHAIGRYVVDFYSRDYKLIIEVDGEIHNIRTQEDYERELYFETFGYKVLRFNNDEVMNAMDTVLGTIMNYFVRS